MGFLPFSWILQIGLLPESSSQPFLPSYFEGFGKYRIRWARFSEFLSVWRYQLVTACWGNSDVQGCCTRFSARSEFAQVCFQPFRHQFPKLPTGNGEEFQWEEFNQFCQEVVLVHIINILLSISGIKARVKPKNEKFRNHLARKQNLIKKMSRKKKMRASLITMMTSTLLRKDGKQLKF